MVNSLKKLWRGQKGITGLETAIILIAFVVVAAVFAYTVLSAGLFSTQKGQEAVYSGLKEARSTLEIRGGVTATANSSGSGGTIKQISFVVSGVLGGEPIDFTNPEEPATASGLANATSDNKVVISYIDAQQEKNNLYWTAVPLGDADTDAILEQNEKFLVTIGGDTTGTVPGNLCDLLTYDLGVNTTFSIVVRPPVGAVLEIERTTPAGIDTIMNLH